MRAAAVLMCASYLTIAMGSSRAWQLLGVAFGSLQASGMPAERIVCHADSTRLSME